MQTNLENYFGFAVGNGDFTARPNYKIGMFTALKKHLLPNRKNRVVISEKMILSLTCT